MADLRLRLYFAISVLTAGSLLVSLTVCKDGAVDGWEPGALCFASVRSLKIDRSAKPMPMAPTSRITMRITINFAYLFKLLPLLHKAKVASELAQGGGINVANYLLLLNQSDTRFPPF